MTVAERNKIIEAYARKLLHERAMQRVADNPRIIPCQPYKTWEDYEDARWRTLWTASMNRLRNSGAIPRIQDCEDYDFMTYRKP